MHGFFAERICCFFATRRTSPPTGKMRQAAAPAASSPKKAGQGFSAHVGAKAAQAAALQALHTLRRAQPAPCVSRAQVSPARPLQVASSLFYEGIGHFDGARYEEALVCFEQALAINEKCLRRRCTSRAHRLAFCRRRTQRLAPPPARTRRGLAPSLRLQGLSLAGARRIHPSSATPSSCRVVAVDAARQDLPQ